ncbi:DegT/DnrJ/EryC1/StrS family aminotransferase [Paracidovorax cattleyae]|uniref:dTDP-4-amino-4,6-dideoxygalactose transaminase n=1 Tax=Paracidovorax cattleyae TaxID=80868 RepID=A0A1H0TSB9_9BURK|nr:DegT/DnrJ/EryC1/StrS family aminotransferase [Paracidovorax cattleyae]SDP56466.1 dTDP-4-amino-4,6-dideoxygalactose transaminase [Paracidovorax cattleyae]
MSAGSSTDPIPLLVPDVPDPQALLPYLQRMHASRYYSNGGPLVRELEARFAERFGVSRAQVATVASATLGLELVLQSLGLREGARVLVPTFTFAATATAVLRAGHVPVLCDVEDGSWLLTPEIAAAAHAAGAVDAVLPVAALGMPHDMAAWRRFEETTGLPVVIDAAAGFGSQWLADAHGTLVFSLHATKSLPAGEGGFVVSSRPGLAERVRQLSNFGINLDPASHLPVGALAAAGTNAKMSELHAAVALASLACWEQGARTRRTQHRAMQEALARAAGGRLAWQQVGPAGGIAAPTLLCARMPDAACRDRLEALCAGQGIATRRWYQPLMHRMEALVPRSIVRPAPRAEALAGTLIGLPFFPHMPGAQMSRLIGVMEQAMRG